MSNSLEFKNSVLESGNDLQEGSKYRFSDVKTGIDAIVEVVKLNNSATLDSIDDNRAGIGTLGAFQPRIKGGGNANSNADFTITFVEANTNTPTSIDNVPITWIDLDGNGNQSVEYVEFGEFLNYRIEKNSVLTVNQGDAGKTRFIGGETIYNQITDLTETAVTTQYDRLTTFSFKAGILTANEGVRQFSVSFDNSIVDKYQNPQDVKIKDSLTITSNGGGDTATVEVRENNIDITNVITTDSIAGETIDYSISGGADKDKFTISDQGELTFVTAADYEKPNDANQDRIYEIEVTATNSQGDRDTQAIAVNLQDLSEDNTVPVVTVNSKTSNDTTPEITGKVSDTDATVKVLIDGAEYEAVNNKDGTWTLPDDTIVPGLLDGVYDVQVKATNSAGKSGSDRTKNEIEIKGKAIEVSIDNQVISNDSTPEITGKLSEPDATILVAIDGREYQATNNQDGTWTLSPDKINPPLKDGEYDLSVTATTPDKRVGKATNSLTIDTIDPQQPTINSPAKIIAESTPIFAGDAQPGADVLVELDTDGDGKKDASYQVVADTNGKWTVDTEKNKSTNNQVPTFKNGDVVTVFATATDDAKNSSAIATTTLEVQLGESIATNDLFSVRSGVANSIDVLKNDAGENLTITNFSQPKSGRVRVDDNNTPNNPNDDRLIYTPNSVKDITGKFAFNQINNTGLFDITGDSTSSTDTFTYTIKDNDGNLSNAQVQVNVNAAARLKFTLTDNQAIFQNEIGVFKVDDAQGTIDGIKPGEDGYIEAALKSGKVIFSSLSESSELFGSNPTRILDGFNSNDKLSFFLVQNGTADEILSDLKANRQANPVFFSNNNANQDNVEYLDVSQLENGGFNFKFEDFQGGDGDFNDLTIEAEVTNELSITDAILQGGQQRELFDERDRQGSLELEIETFSDAVYENTVGFYVVENENGAIFDFVSGKLLNPNDPGYAETAIQQRLDFTLNKNTDSLQKQIQAGDIIAPFIIANGTVEEFLANNAGDEKPVAYFNYIGANPDDTDHIRLLGDNVVGIEDLNGGGDRDYNDFIFKITTT